MSNSESSMSWNGGALTVIDQRVLPHERRLLQISTVDELIDAISTLAIRGAPAIGVAGAFGVVLAAFNHPSDPEKVRAEAARIVATRPTAVNLAKGVERALSKLSGDNWNAIRDDTLDEALAMIVEDGDINRRAATHAADLIERLCGGEPHAKFRVLTHCNTGGLATTSFGTAFGAIRVLHERGKIEEVLVDETRPLLQGARLTTWELDQLSVPYRLMVDSAAAWAMRSEEVDCVVVGADRIAADGAVANKIGTYSLALAARWHGVPFVVVAPESTCDSSTPSGDQIVVEQRPSWEVLGFGGEHAAPYGAEVFNPAFDVTPPNLVTAVVTENGTQGYYAETSARQIVDAARGLYEFGWMPGTAGNISMRTDDVVMITASGLSKGKLTSSDVVTVTLDGQQVDGVLTPSAETAIHAAIYRSTNAKAVVHVHSPFATALSVDASRFGGCDASRLRFTGYELIKGLTTLPVLSVPVFPNYSDVHRIASTVERHLSEENDLPVMIVAGHGVTAWGTSLAQARNRVECLEALCELVTLTNRQEL